ncbi:DUF6438 domain-containing protein [Ferruginibacter sp. SUN106]|uniref:DUF6438 domain-containing protein n=1 Tax=Ferruginibacter sp. SUN106 TaxID=2978348 RepID=UPI003D35E289
MKYLLIAFFLLLFYVPLLAQHNQLKGTWYSADQEIMVIEDTSGRLENLMQRGEDFSNLVVTKKAISFRRQYYSSRTNYNVLYTDKFDFKILNCNDSVLTVMPVSDFSKKFFLNRGTIRFVKKQYWISKDLKVGKVFFHSSECFGSCPLIDIEIDPDRTVKYKLGGFATEAAKSGHFIGKMPDSTYQFFLLLLQNCQLETLRWNSVQCCDGVVVTLIFYFNKERKYLKSMLPSVITNDMLDFFYTIESKVVFKRTDEKFYMEE